MKDEKTIRADIKENLYDLSKDYDGVTEFANALGRSRQTVGYWLNGDRIPDAVNLGVIRDRLGVSIDWLLGFGDPDVPTSDEDIRKMCKYTGLSQKAVENLHGSIIPLVPNGRKALTAIPESDLLPELVRILGTYLFAYTVWYKLDGGGWGAYDIPSEREFKGHIQKAQLFDLADILAEIEKDCKKTYKDEPKGDEH